MEPNLSSCFIIVIIPLLFLTFFSDQKALRKVYSLMIFPNYIHLIVGIGGINTSEIIFFGIRVHASFFGSILGYMVYFIYVDMKYFMKLLLLII